MTEARLHEALAAWNTGDAERVLEFWSDDCVLPRLVRPRAHGPQLHSAATRRARASRRSSTAIPDGIFADTEVMVAGDRGAAEWTFRATGDDGEPFEVRGCDLFEFDGDLIRVKNAFRKVRETLD